MSIQFSRQSYKNDSKRLQCIAAKGRVTIKRAALITPTNILLVLYIYCCIIIEYTDKSVFIHFYNY